MVYAKVPTVSLSPVQAIHEQSKCNQFLMKLHYEFEVARSNLMNRDPCRTLYVYFRELLLTQAMFQQDPTLNPVAYAVHKKGKDM